MSYSYGGPGQGYPAAPGYPQPGYGGAPQMGIPTPEAASGAGYGQLPSGLPYGTAPPGGVGFGPNTGYGSAPAYNIPVPPASSYNQPGGYPAPSATGYPGGGAAGYPQAGGYPQGGSAPGYPQGGSAPGYPQGGSAPGYPQGGSAPGYPQGGSAPGYPQGGSAPGYPQGGSAPGYPQGSSVPGYPQGGSAPGYPQGSPAPGYGQPAGTGAGYGTAAGYAQPGGYQQPAGYPGQAPATGGYGQGHAAPSGLGGMSYAPNVAPGANVMPLGSGGANMGYRVKEDGTLKPAPNFNAENDTKILRKAMKGFGTDEKAIIDVLAHRTADQRIQIKTMFKTMFGKDLTQELKSELGGRFEDAIIALMFKPREYDAYELRRAMKGAGTDEDAMIEILCSRNNAQIHEINEIYKTMYRQRLEQDIVSDTSGHFKRLMVSMANAGRMENQPVDMNKANADAQALFQAGEKKWGTDESQFNAILASQSFEQLRAVFDAYSRISGRDIEQVIKNEMSGNLELGMLAIVKCVRNKPAYFAEKLLKSMKGAGTDDKTLIRVIVTRAEIDMVQIKAEFQRLYGKPLDQFIREDTSGDYRMLLLGLVGGGY